MILYELLIALSLTTILLTFLFSFFVQSAKLDKRLEKTRSCMASRGYIQTRLQSLLTSIDRANPAAYFYTKQLEHEKTASLITIFDNGIDPDPAFSGSIMSRFYLDSAKNLCITTWPLIKEKDRPWRKEILLSRVSKFEWEFLGKIEATEHGVKENCHPINANLCWKSSWNKNSREIPSIIRLFIYEEGVKEPLRYAFILPVLEPLVIYRDKKVVL